MMKPIFALSSIIAILLLVTTAAQAQSQPESFKEFVERRQKITREFLTALINSDTNACEQLMKKGYELSDTNSVGNTPLVIATLAGNLKMIEWLLDHGAKVDQPGSLGRTPAMRAAASNNKQALDRLLAAGADTTKKDNFGLTLQDWRNHSGIIQTLMLFDKRLAQLNNTIELLDERDRDIPTEKKPTDYDGILRREFDDYAVSELLPTGASLQHLQNQQPSTRLLFSIALDAKRAIFRAGNSRQAMVQALPNLFLMHSYRLTARVLGGKTTEQKIKLETQRKQGKMRLKPSQF